MALTTGINVVYSSAYKSLPQKALPIGTPSSVYEPLAQSENVAGMLFIQYFEYIVPVGFGYASATNYDVLKLLDVGGSYSNLAGNTVIPGLRLKNFTLKCSGNAGGTVPCFIGWQNANNLFNPNANTSGYIGGGAVVGTGVSTTSTGSAILQSATTIICDDAATGTNISDNYSVTPLTAADSLILVPTRAGAVATTTQQTLQGRAIYYLTGPTGY